MSVHALDKFRMLTLDKQHSLDTFCPKAWGAMAQGRLAQASYVQVARSLYDAEGPQWSMSPRLYYPWQSLLPVFASGGSTCLIYSHLTDSDSEIASIPITG